MGKRDVINIRIKVYNYGGYVMAIANQNFFNKYNDSYLLSTRIDSDKWNFAASANLDLKKSKSNIESQTTYIFPLEDGTDNVVTQASEQLYKMRSNNESVVAKAWNNSKSFFQSHEIGYNRGEIPYNHSSGFDTYSSDGDHVPAPTVTDGSQLSNAMYYSFRGRASELTERSYLATNFYGSYAWSKYDDCYRLESPTDPLTIANRSKNESVTAELQVSYGVDFSPTRRLTTSIFSSFTNTRNNYDGYTVDKIRRDRYSNGITLKYSDKFGDLRTDLSGYIPVQTFTSNRAKTKSIFAPTLFLNLDYSLAQTDQLGFNAEYHVTPLSFYNYGGIARRDDALNGSAPNYNAKNEHRFNCSVNWFHRFSQSFNISPHLFYRFTKNAGTRLYAPSDGVMYSYMSTAGDESNLYLSARLQYLFPSANLSCYITPRYNFSIRKGDNRYTDNHYDIYFGVSWVPIKRWSIFISGSYQDNGWMETGGYAVKIRNNFSMSLSTSYSIGNLAIEANVTSPWNKTNGEWYRTNSPYCKRLSYSIGSEDMSVRHVSLSLRYSFDFGRKADHIDLRFSGSSVDDK